MVGAKAVETQDVVERIVTFKRMLIRHENVIGRSTRLTGHAGANARRAVGLCTNGRVKI